MAWRDRLVNILGGADGALADPNQVVEVAEVRLWQSALVVHALGDANIEAVAVDRAAAPALPGLRPKSRIMVRAGDARAAEEIITKALADDEISPS
jgi:hypothetical protein